MAEGDAPKIIVDSDWKSQARAEKERLAAAERQQAAEKQKKAETAGGGGAPAPGAGPRTDSREPREMPPADFQALLGTLITQALMYLGAFPDPETGRAVVSLDHGRFHIDLIGVLEEKTKGNLTQAEADDMKQALHELRIRYVEISKAVAQMAQKGKGAGPGQLAGPAFQPR